MKRGYYTDASTRLQLDDACLTSTMMTVISEHGRDFFGAVQVLSHAEHHA